MVEKNTLNLRLNDIEDQRDRKVRDPIDGTLVWIESTHNVIRLFPDEERKKIAAFMARKQRENAKNLLDSLEKVRVELLKMLNASGENIRKGEEIVFETQRFKQIKTLIAQIDPYVARLDVGLAGELLDYEWKILEQMEG